MRRSAAIGWFLGLAAVVAAGAPRAEAADFVFPQTGRCTSNYYSSRPYGIHQALDIAGPNQSNITAGRSGTISFYGVSGGYGNLMIVTHEAGYTTYYAHLTRAVKSVGAHVSTGDVIALEGSTGNSTGPHVHYEVRRYGTKQYVPGSVGATFTRGAGLPHDYPGIGDAPGGGGNPGGGGGSGAQNKAFRVNASALNVRSGPSTSNASIGLIYSGQVYVSGETSNGWHKIWFDGRSGWSSAGYLVQAGGVTGEVVTADALNVRSGPSTGNSIVTTIHRGQRYVRAGTSGAWEKIYFGGTTRWVHGDYTSETGY